MCRYVPAVDHCGTSSGWSLGLNTADEAQQASGVKRHAMIRPASEVKLADLPDLCHPPLRQRHMLLQTQSNPVSGQKPPTGYHTPSGRQTQLWYIVFVCVCVLPSPQRRSGSHTLTAAGSRSVSPSCHRRSRCHLASTYNTSPAHMTVRQESSH